MQHGKPVLANPVMLFNEPDGSGGFVVNVRRPDGESFQQAYSFLTTGGKRPDRPATLIGYFNAADLEFPSQR